MVLVMSSWGLIKRGLKVVVRDILVWGLGVCAVLEFMMSCLFSLEFYIGETGDPICIRTTGHRQQIKPTAKDRPVAADIHIEQCSQREFKMFPFFNHHATIHI